MMNTKFKIITPEIAKDILKKNGMNRPVKPGNVNFLVNEINSGKWMVTHQGICISEEGDVIDGQHRLLAIIKSEKPVTMMLTTGAKKDSFKVIDVGRKRSQGDLLAIEGLEHHKDLPGLAQRILAYHMGSLIDKGNHHHIDDIIDLCKSNTAELSEAILRSKECPKFYSKPVASFCYWILRDTPRFMDVLDQIITGETLNPYVLKFRETLIDMKIRKLRMSSHEMVTRTLHVVLCSIEDRNKRLGEIFMETPYNLIRELKKINNRWSTN